MLGIAKAHLCLGNHQEALETYSTVIPLWRKLKDTRNEAASQNDLGVLYASLGSWEQARAAHQAALTLRITAHDLPGQGESLVNLGMLDVQMRAWRAALAQYDKALALPRTDPDKRFTGYALEGRAEALFHLGHRAESLSLLQRSVDDLREVGDRAGEAYSWRMLGEAKASTEDYRHAISLAHEAGDAPAEAVSLFELATVQRARGDLTGARASLERALPIIESTRADSANPNLRMNYLRVSRSAYELYVEVLLKADPSDREASLVAFQASERAHARTLLDEMGPHGTTPAPAALEEIRALALDGNTVLLEYLLGEKSSWLWMIGRGAFERFELPPRAALERSARAFYRTITARDARMPDETPAQRAARLRLADRQAAEQSAVLARELLGPVRARLGARRVVLVEDGMLYLIPFAALGIRGEVAMAPSASVLVELRRNPHPFQAKGPVLIVADPVFDASDPRVETRTPPRSGRRPGL